VGGALITNQTINSFLCSPVPRLLQGEKKLVGDWPLGLGTRQMQGGGAGVVSCPDHTSHGHERDRAMPAQNAGDLAKEN